MGLPCSSELVVWKNEMISRSRSTLPGCFRFLLVEQSWIEPNFGRGLNLVFNVPERCLVMLDESLDSQIGLTVEDGLHDSAVLLQGIPVAVGRCHRDETVALRLIHQVLADPD
jgi:hypothetical protein